MLPPLASGLKWDTSSLGIDGSIKVINVPAISSIVVSGGNVILSGSGGQSSANFYVLGSTNVTLPFSS